jgi:hypothetical protein
LLSKIITQKKEEKHTKKIIAHTVAKKIVLENHENGNFSTKQIERTTLSQQKSMVNNIEHVSCGAILSQYH